MAIIKLRLRPSDVKRTYPVVYKFRENPPRVLVTYTDTNGKEVTRYITVVASDPLNEKDITKFLADCLASEEDITQQS